MVSSSRRAFLGEVVPREICIVILVLLNQSVMAMSSIVALPVEERVSEGGTAKIHFELCGKEKPSCTLEQSLNLSAPSPECTLDHRHGRCEMTVAPQNSPFRLKLHNACEVCVLVVHGVTQVDAGQYSMCQTSNICASGSVFWRDIYILEIENDPTPSSTPGHVSTDRTENTTPDAPKITKPTTEKSPEKNSVVGTDKTTENDSQTGMKLSSAVGIPVTLIILLALAIVAVVYICKRNTRRRGHEQYQPPSNSLLNGNTTTGCQSTMIEIDSENAPVHEGPDSNMQ